MYGNFVVILRIWGQTSIPGLSVLPSLDNLPRQRKSIWVRLSFLFIGQDFSFKYTIPKPNFPHHEFLFQNKTFLYKWYDINFLIEVGFVCGIWRFVQFLSCFRLCWLLSRGDAPLLGEIVLPASVFVGLVGTLVLFGHPFCCFYGYYSFYCGSSAEFFAVAASDRNFCYSFFLLLLQL
jgi:hypothetical protein